jgi:hypothetical protein
MSYFNNVTRLCELAFRAYARSIGLGNIPYASIIAGFDDTDIMIPRLIFNADTAEPEGPGDEGNWTIRLEVQVVTSRDDDKVPRRHHDRAGEVFSQFMAGRYTVPDLINAAAAAEGINFICWDIMPGQQAKDGKDRHLFSSMLFNVVGCGSLFSAVEPVEPGGLLEEGGDPLLNEDGEPLLVEG